MSTDMDPRAGSGSRGLDGELTEALVRTRRFFTGVRRSADIAQDLTAIPHDYRESVPPWFRSIFYLQPKPELMAAAPLGFQLHALSAWVLFAFWPFSRLVHVFSMPLGHLTRPYIGYRSRDTELGNRAPHRGWERVK